MNIVGLSSTTNPYIQARWSAFTTEHPEYKVSLIEFGRVSTVYDWKPVEVSVPYERVVLSEGPSQYRSLRQVRSLIKKLIQALEKINPDILVLNGYQQPATLAALGWSKLKGKPVVLLSESKADDAPRKWFTETIKRGLISQYQSALVGGEKHREYLVQLGMASEAIFLGHNVIGNDDYASQRLSVLSRPHDITKSYFLAINRFIPKKNIPTILQAYANYRQGKQDGSAWDLVLCGDGQLRSQLQQQINQLSLESAVHLTGFLQPHELLPYFAHASCFIHASTQEQWGLVVNEAMAAGLPVLVSRCCGCFDELVKEGDNGFGFEANQPAELAQLMETMSRQDSDRERMAQASLEHIRKFGPSFFSQGLQRAVLSAVGKAPSKISQHGQKQTLPTETIATTMKERQEQPS